MAFCYPLEYSHLRWEKSKIKSRPLHARRTCSQRGVALRRMGFEIRDLGSHAISTLQLTDSGSVFFNLIFPHRLKKIPPTWNCSRDLFVKAPGTERTQISFKLAKSQVLLTELYLVCSCMYIPTETYTFWQRKTRDHRHLGSHGWYRSGGSWNGLWHTNRDIHPHLIAQSP